MTIGIEKPSKGTNAKLILWLVIAPGFLPIAVHLLVSSNLLNLPSYMNRSIFLIFAGILYFVCIPLLLVLKQKGASFKGYLAAGAIVPILVFGLLSLLRPIPDLDDEQFMSLIVPFSASCLGLMGASASLIFNFAMKEH
jgi:hypothetical protein